MDAPPSTLQPDDDAAPGAGMLDLRGEFVAAYGTRVFLALSAVGSLFLLPFSINNFVQHRWALGSASIAVVLFLLGNALALALRRPPPFPAVFLFGPALVALGIAMYSQGLIGILWAYAAILLFHFVLPRRAANLFNGAIVLMAAASAWTHLGPEVTARVAVTMSLTVLFTNIFSSITDAQRRKEAGQRHRLDLLVRGTNAGAVEWDAEGPVRFSRRLRGMLGLPVEGLTGRWTLRDFIHPDDRERVDAQARAAFAARGRPRSVVQLEADDCRLLTVTGEAVWVHTESIAVMDARGRTERFICWFMDIGDRVRAQEALMRSHEQVREQARQLEAQNEALRDAIRVREEVERIARHDLKTPLASIASVPRLLRQAGPLGAREEELLSMVENAALRVLAMVNLSLDLYRMEQGTYRLRPQPVDLGALVRTIARELRGHAESKRLTLELRLPAQPLHAKGEELLCYSILANLMKNALEASPEGGTVTVALREHSHAAQTVLLSIHNAGAVQPPARERFFEKYVSHGKAGGTGLGAYSARLMAQVQCGDLQMATGDAHGTTLTLWLPLWPQAVAARGRADDATIPFRRIAPEASGPGPLSVLLVDDDPYNILVLRSLLPPEAMVEEAVNGRAALERVAARRPDIVFLDLQMPVMGGPEAIGEIRRIQRERGDAPSVVVAFSAWDDEATRRECEEAGFDHYLVKPASREEVMAIVRGDAARCGAAPGPDDDARALMPEFIASRRVVLGQLRDAADRGDREAVRAAAHMLAGSLGMYGFESAGEMSRVLASKAAAAEPHELALASEELAARFERDASVLMGSPA